MTREEAIRELEILKEDYWDDDGYGHETKQYDDTMLALDMAIKALEQEPTTKNDLGVDAVSRKDVHDMLENLPVTVENKWFNWLQMACMRLAELPSVIPQEPRWIPVSEKLPNDRDWYLGIFKEPDTGWINPLPFICDYVGRETKATTKGYWILRGFTDWDDYKVDYYFNLECVAWMPLPKPYREVKE